MAQSNRVLNLTDRGEVRLYESAVNGLNKLILKAPDSMASDATWVFPETDGVAGQFLGTDGAGNLSWQNGSAASLDSCYDYAGAGTGRVIDVNAGALQLNATNTNEAQVVSVGTGGGIGIRVYQSSANNALRLEKSNTDGGNALQLFNSGSGDGINIEQRGNGCALDVVVSAASAAAAIAVFNNGAGNCLYLNQTGVAQAIYVNQASNSHAADLQKSDTGSAAVVNVVNSGIGPGVYIQQKANGTGLQVAKTDTGNLVAASIENSGSGATLYLSPLGTGVGLSVAKSTGAAGYPILVSNSGTNSGIYITQQSSLGSNGALQIMVQATANGVDVTQSASGVGVKVNIPVDGADGVWIHKTDTTAPGLASGNAIKVTNSSGADAVVINQSHTGSTAALRINNSGQGYDICGNGSTWYVSPLGTAHFTKLDHPKMADSGIGGNVFISSATTLSSISITVPNVGATSVSLHGQLVYQPNGDDNTAIVYLKRGTTSLRAITVTGCKPGSGSAFQSYPITVVDVTPGAGTYTYTLSADGQTNDRAASSHLTGILVNCTGTSF